MTTWCLTSHSVIATQASDARETEALPRYEIDAEERRWQLEWERRNIED
jgi:hypothetical protein